MKYYIYLFFYFLSFFAIADTPVPVNAGPSNITELYKMIAIGSKIEALIKIPINSIIESFKSIANRSVANDAVTIFKAIFLIDIAYTLANQYLEGEIKQIPSTFVVKAFFYSCFISLLNNARILGMISEMMQALFSSLGGYSIDYSWLNDGNYGHVFEVVSNGGILTKIDELFIETFKNVDGYNVNGLQVLFFLIGLFVVGLILYVMAIKLLFGVLIKCLEWSIGMPIAFLMLAGKGNPATEEFFSKGIRYIYTTILDFAVTFACLNIGITLLESVIKGMSKDQTLAGTLIGLFNMVISMSILKKLVSSSEMITAALASGSPTFHAGMAGGILSNMANMGTKMSKTFASTPKAMGAGIINRIKGGTFKSGFASSMLKDSKNVLNGISGEFKHSTDEGLNLKKIQSERINKLTGEVEKYQKNVVSSKTVKRDNHLANAWDEHKQAAEEHREHRVNLRNFEKKYKISDKQMQKMGFYTENEKNMFMNFYEELDKNKKEYEKYGVEYPKMSSKDANLDRKNLQKMSKELDKRKMEENLFNGEIQLRTSSNSDLTKNMKEIFSHANNSDGRISSLNTWLNKGFENIKEFSFEDFKDAYLQHINEINSNPKLSIGVKKNQIKKSIGFLKNNLENFNANKESIFDIDNEYYEKNIDEFNNSFNSLIDFTNKI